MHDLFSLTADHITLLRRSNVSEQLSGNEYGAAEIDPKRPYGNSDVEGDLAKILGIDVSDDGDIRPSDLMKIKRLHSETPIALQIVLQTGAFQPGVYGRTNYGPWEPQTRHG